MQTIQASIIGILLSLGSAMVAADVVVVVSAQSDVNQLQRVNVENIFFGRNYSFPEGTDAVPLDLEEGALERDEFYIKLAGRNAAQIKSFWAKLIFTGRGRPPAVARDTEQLISRLVANPNAIGYVDRSEVDERLRIVFTPLLISEESNNREEGSAFPNEFSFPVKFLAVADK